MLERFKINNTTLDICERDCNCSLPEIDDGSDLNIYDGSDLSIYDVYIYRYEVLGSPRIHTSTVKYSAKLTNKNSLLAIVQDWNVDERDEIIFKNIITEIETSGEYENHETYHAFLIFDKSKPVTNGIIESDVLESDKLHEDLKRYFHRYFRDWNLEYAAIETGDGAGNIVNKFRKICRE